MKTCLNCQRLLIRKDQKKFCSRSCSASHNNTGLRRHSKPESKYSMVKLCKTCGIETPRPTYCSDKCNPKRRNVSPEESHAKDRAIHNEAWQRYMAKRKNQTPDDVNIKELQEFYINCPEGYEVDHIMPISKGGLHCLSNLQYLTISENRRKSNKLIGPGPGN